MALKKTKKTSPKKRRKSSKKHKLHHLEFLKAIKSMPPAKRSHLMHYLTDRGIDILCECAHNLLYVDHKLSSEDSSTLRSKLKSNLKKLRFLSTSKHSIKQKRNVLQKGGMLGMILSAAIPLLASLLFGKK